MSGNSKSPDVRKTNVGPIKRVKRGPVWQRMIHGACRSLSIHDLVSGSASCHCPLRWTQESLRFIKHQTSSRAISCHDHSHSFAFSLFFPASHCLCISHDRMKLYKPAIPATGGHSNNSQAHQSGLFVLTANIT